MNANHSDLITDLEIVLQKIEGLIAIAKNRDDDIIEAELWFAKNRIEAAISLANDA